MGKSLAKASETDMWRVGPGLYDDTVSYWKYTPTLLREYMKLMSYMTMCHSAINSSVDGKLYMLYDTCRRSNTMGTATYYKAYDDTWTCYSEVMS